MKILLAIVIVMTVVTFIECVKLLIEAIRHKLQSRKIKINNLFLLRKA